jgi:hypothetical protein
MTVSLSDCLGLSAPELEIYSTLDCCKALWGSGPEIFFQPNPCGCISHVTSSLTIGLVCLLWIPLDLSSIRMSQIAWCWKFFSLHTSPLSVQGSQREIKSIEIILCCYGSVVTWTVVNLAIAKLKLLIPAVSMSDFTLCVHSYNFVWLLLVACTILLYNYIYSEGWKPCKNREPVWPLKNFQWTENIVLQVLQF